MSLLFVLTGAPLSLLLAVGAASALALVGLYLLREQHRPLLVPFIELWRQKAEQRRSSMPWQRLRRLLSLLLQLILLGLLVLALGDPRSDEAARPGRWLVLVVDVSPSMTARLGEKSAATRLDEAKKRLLLWTRELNSRDRALVMTMSTRPQIECGWTNDRDRLERSIEAIAARDSAADLPRALELARDVLPARSEADVILIGDGAYPPLAEADTTGLRLSFEPITPPGPTTSSENVGISNFSARRYPDEPRRFEAQLEVSSTAKESAEVELVLRSIDASFRARSVIEVKRALVPANGRLVVPLAQLSGATEGVIAEVRRVDGGSDFLPTDNHARLLLRPLPPLRVLLVGPPNQFIEAALLAEPEVVTRRSGPDADGWAADVVIYDGEFPVRKPGAAALYLGVPDAGAAYPVQLGRELKAFGFDHWRRDSPLFASVDPYDVQVLAGRALLPNPGDTALAFSGQDPIAVTGQRSEGRFVALGFDPRQSDFFLRAAWPLFLHNTLRELAPAALGDDGVGVVPGREWHLRTPSTDPSARIRGPLGQASSVDRGAAVTEQRTTVFGELAGFYEVEQGGPKLRFFANYFDDGEARLAPTRTLEARGAATPARALPRPRPLHRDRDLAPWLLFLTVAALLSFSEWWTYHRRWTV